MARQHEDQVVVIGIAGRDTVDAFEEFVDRHELTHITHIADVDGEVWERFGIRGQPAWVFVDREGTQHTLFGALGVEAFAEQVEEHFAP